jgi:GNAT superfamily N-acetyltransferase
MDTPSGIIFRWARSEAEAGQLAVLFSNDLSNTYISHSELQGPRAHAPNQWAPDIERTIERDIAARVDQPLDPEPGRETRLTATAIVDDTCVGVFLVTFNRVAPVPYCIIEDMMIAPRHRNRGVGMAFVEWISDQSRARGIRRLFLESGISNESAHRFFESTGFERVSVVMMKQI